MERTHAPLDPRLSEPKVRYGKYTIEVLEVRSVENLNKGWTYTVLSDDDTGYATGWEPTRQMAQVAGGNAASKLRWAAEQPARIRRQDDKEMFRKLWAEFLARKGY